MAYSTCCRVAMVSCLVLCVSLLLPRTFLSRGGGRQEPGAAPLAAPAPPEGKLGRFPPRMHYQVTPDSRATPHFPRSHLAEAVAKAKAGGGGGGSTGGSGRGLVGQIIPIYGFGIFLYILYILFKLASKGKTIAGERKCPIAAPGNMKRKISYPEETYPVYDNSDCFKRKQDTILVDYPDLSQPSAEELAERMEGMEDEGHLCNETLLTDLTTGRGGLALMQKKDEITDTSEEERGLHHSQSIEECCCCYEDDDPAVIAENAGFHSDSCSEAEESSQEDLSVESENENAALKKQKASDSDETGTLRKRNTKGLE
ncbi:protein RIC-3 isoform X3 [Numenius arquata]|uniref:protein RIC-3 isoform X3 n=1 Tax=Numenius arquata TaxID=31919 RepID=UPI003D30A134